MVKKPIYRHIQFQNDGQINPSSVSTKKTIATSDLHLWQEFKKGSESAFALIYEDHAAGLYSYGLKVVYNKELVKDTIQDLFIEIWDAKERLASVESIKAYLYKSLRRKLIVRASKVRKTFDKNKDINDLDKKIPSAEVSLIEKQRFEEQRLALQKALNMLNDKQREIIHLKFYGRLSYSEVMEIMSLDKKGVYNLMARTIKVLKQNLVIFALLGILFFIL
ncbi:RNA polymerase sigma factor [Flavivirga spongiicola]|uniref:Sigma-70 family RNA polymerase sigma factor n=1 Tax=Flavivirga spongiicola TaxID=421621 RepID=A0ABU7XMD1_9FLAO|nr:sigma-70 family RNA polymerase sigma factor [Flavivirga sp. MEBiC05379]MDO5981390.1 sigma-70 family RNA polymerase sigma factor [Flavivirga sp. MEBiC05379]